MLEKSLKKCGDTSTMEKQVWQMIAASHSEGEESPGFTGQDAG